MKVVGWVFYEDQYTGRPPTEFGPHNLVCACVVDECPIDGGVFALRKEGLKPNPCKGANKLLSALESHETLSSDGAHTFALFDADHVREAIGFAKSETREAVIAELVKRIAPKNPLRLHVHLLEQNTETLLSTLRACDESVRGIEAAIAKDMNARDIALNRAALAPGNRSVRDCIRGRIPSFDAFVKDIARAVGDERRPVT